MHHVFPPEGDSFSVHDPREYSGRRARGPCGAVYSVDCLELVANAVGRCAAEEASLLIPELDRMDTFSNVLLQIACVVALVDMFSRSV